MINVNISHNRWGESKTNAVLKHRGSGLSNDIFQIFVVGELHPRQV